VRGMQRSRTAQAVVVERAVTNMGVLEDSVAGAMLTPSMVAIFSLVKHVPPCLRGKWVTLAGR
jgi:hypothetical protein